MFFGQFRQYALFSVVVLFSVVSSYSNHYLFQIVSLRSHGLSLHIGSYYFSKPRYYSVSTVAIQTLLLAYQVVRLLPLIDLHAIQTLV